MEKVPQLDMFSHRQAKKSNSLSRLGVNNSFQRPISSYQSGQNFFKEQGYYGSALRMLNQNKETHFRKPQHHCQEGLNKTNIKKITKNHTQEKFFKVNHQHIQQTQQINTQPPKNIMFRYADSHKNIEGVHQIPPCFSIKTIANQNTPQYFIPQQQQQFQQPIYIQQMHHPQNNNFVNPQKHLQKSNSMQMIPNMHQNIAMFHKKDEIINNEQQQALNGGKNNQKIYTFNEISSKNNIPQKKINRHFTFDATYLLQVKQSQEKLASVCSFTTDKAEEDEQGKKRQLLEQLIQIKEDNIHEGQRIIGQLNSLIEQFQCKDTFQFSDSTFRNSRRSMFSKLK